MRPESKYNQYVERVLLTLSLSPTQLTPQLAKVCALSNPDMAYLLIMMRSSGLVVSESFEGGKYVTWKLSEEGKRLAVSGERPDKEKGMYYVFNEQGGKPSVVHASYESAESEAARLSKQHRGMTFRVLKVVADVCLPTPQPEVVKY